MAQFIKIGSELINLEHVTKVEYAVGGETVYVRFGPDGGHSDFDGEQGLALRRYFNSIAADILSDYRHYKARQETKRVWSEFEEWFWREVKVSSGLPDSALRQKLKDYEWYCSDIASERPSAEGFKRFLEWEKAEAQEAEAKEQKKAPPETEPEVN